MTQQLQPPAARPLGRLAGLDLAWMPSTLWGMAAIWIGLSAIAFFLLGFNLWAALLGGLIGVVIHWVLGVLAPVRARAGRPPHRVPDDRAALLGDLQHVAVAAGRTPAAGADPYSAGAGRADCQYLAGGAGAGGGGGDWPDGGLGWWLAVFAAFDNLLVLGLGAFAPLGFTDGSTILYWWGRR